MGFVDPTGLLEEIAKGGCKDKVTAAKMVGLFRRTVNEVLLLLFTTRQNR
jgi:hypothetical protein